MYDVGAQWIRLCLPSCHPDGLESQTRRLRFNRLLSNLCYICHFKRTKINKRGRILPIFKNAQSPTKCAVCEMNNSVKLGSIHHSTKTKNYFLKSFGMKNKFFAEEG